MEGYIEFKDENGTYRVTRDNPPITLSEVIEEMVIPMLLAAGYHPDSINRYYMEAPCGSSTDTSPDTRGASES